MASVSRCVLRQAVQVKAALNRDRYIAVMEGRGYRVEVGAIVEADLPHGLLVVGIFGAFRSGQQVQDSRGAKHADVQVHVQ